MKILVDADACPVANVIVVLMERHAAQKARRANKKNHLKGPRKRTAEDDMIFKAKFETLLNKLLVRAKED